MRLRLLNYCTLVWMKWQRAHERERRLPLIVPLVFYQGVEPWRFDREFADLVTGAAPQWRWVPRFEHLMIDQTRQSADSVTGAVAARLAQVAMMATFREAHQELIEQATRLIRELDRVAGFDEVARHVEYLLATHSTEWRTAFAAALRRNVPGRGGELMNYVQQMVERGRRAGHQEGRQEGELMGQLQTIQAFLKRDVPWATIEAATGIDEATFRRLKHQFDINGADLPRE